MRSRYASEFREWPSDGARIDAEMRDLFAARNRGPKAAVDCKVRIIPLDEESAFKASWRKPSSHDRSMAKPYDFDRSDSMDAFYGGRFLVPPSSDTKDAHRWFEGKVPNKVLPVNQLELDEARQTDFWSSNYKAQYDPRRRAKSLTQLSSEERMRSSEGMLAAFKTQGFRRAAPFELYNNSPRGSSVAPSSAVTAAPPTSLAPSPPSRVGATGASAVRAATAQARIRGQARSTSRAGTRSQA
eukprot:TRINITY_DN37170_c0_g1_i1.p2 TRINITY_DN37170_c0_g1~~TRINITY_DN37170_c0_g1_i1.p2  ORF type:complete len:257 (+),score=52.29 TRINITY_DN37170_c0_g1_i1:48-773(+)